jgi:hypothetical protein
MDRPNIDENGKVINCDKCPFEFKCYDFCKYFAYPLADDCTLITDRKAIEEFFKPHAPPINGDNKEQIQYGLELGNASDEDCQIGNDNSIVDNDKFFNDDDFDGLF